MLVLFLLVQIIVICIYGEKFDPKKVNYCEKKCEDYLKGGFHTNTACDCSKKGYREEYIDNIVKFRKTVLEEHNRLRELVASGKESRSGLTSAADMQALSYSLELEYIARCLARNQFIANHDKCRKMSNDFNAGQNLAGQSIRGDDIEVAKSHVKSWYEEIVDFPSSPSTVEKFQGGGQQMIGHFTEVIWASINLIGCARSYSSQPAKDGYAPEDVALPYWLICNYGSTDGNMINMPNLLNYPVYKRGAPCTACRIGKCDNPEYPSLCGKIEPVPTDPPYDYDNPNNAVTSCSLNFFLIFFAIIFELLQK